MEGVLNKVSELIEKANNVPEEIKPIVKAICHGYIRETNGKVSIDGIINICNTKFTKIDENNQKFSGKERHFADTETIYDNKGNVTHKMRYINSSNTIKLISILTHELGHVITELDTCEVNQNGIYSFLKRTTDFYFGCMYQNGVLKAKAVYGFRMTDGFLESTCSKIFSSPEFRQELLDYGYDLKDYEYKDERIFPSRVYDEYRACFELFDYIMDGALSDFSCEAYTTIQEIEKVINKYKLHIIFSQLDKSNEALWKLKIYEGKKANSEFNELLDEYIKEKKISLAYAKEVLKLFGKNEDDENFQRLYHIYESTLTKQKLLPIPNEYLKTKEQHSMS